MTFAEENHQLSEKPDEEQQTCTTILHRFQKPEIRFKVLQIIIL